MQRSPKAISRNSENDYILEDSEDILRRCKDLLKRFPEVLRTNICWKIPRVSWGDAKISWSDSQRFWERPGKDSEDILRRCKDLLKRLPKTLGFWQRLRGYPEEVQQGTLNNSFLGPPQYIINKCILYSHLLCVVPAMKNDIDVINYMFFPAMK